MEAEGRRAELDNRLPEIRELRLKEQSEKQNSEQANEQTSRPIVEGKCESVEQGGVSENDVGKAEPATWIFNIGCETEAARVGGLWEVQ